VDIASDKDLTTLLARPGCRCRGRSRSDGRGRRPAGEPIGYPVVCKPLDGNHGRGVCLYLQEATRSGPRSRSPPTSPGVGSVIVENFDTGKDYRCLDHQRAEWRPIRQSGSPRSRHRDGEHTVAELFELTNADPAAGSGSREDPDPGSP
jgi:cyanophycin synthetase